MQSCASKHISTTTYLLAPLHRSCLPWPLRPTAFAREASDQNTYGENPRSELFARHLWMPACRVKPPPVSQPTLFPLSCQALFHMTTLLSKCCFIAKTIIYGEESRERLTHFLKWDTDAPEWNSMERYYSCKRTPPLPRPTNLSVPEPRKRGRHRGVACPPS